MSGKHKTRSLKWILIRKLHEAQLNIGLFYMERDTNSEPFERWFEIGKVLKDKLSKIESGELENTRYDLININGIHSFDEYGNFKGNSND